MNFQSKVRESEKHISHLMLVQREERERLKYLRDELRAKEEKAKRLRDESANRKRNEVLKLRYEVRTLSITILKY